MGTLLPREPTTPRSRPRPSRTGCPPSCRGHRRTTAKKTPRGARSTTRVLGAAPSPSCVGPPGSWCASAVSRRRRWRIVASGRRHRRPAPQGWPVSLSLTRAADPAGLNRHPAAAGRGCHPKGRSGVSMCQVDRLTAPRVATPGPPLRHRSGRDERRAGPPVFST